MKCRRGGGRLLALLLALLLTCVPLLMNAQESTHRAKRSFASADGTFRFEYSDSLVPCRRDSHQPDRWLPDDSCEAFTPVCSNFSCDSVGTVACIAYPAEELKDTNFQAAAFSVNELKRVSTEPQCLEVEEPPPHVGTPSYQTVNGVKFRVTETAGLATGNFLDGYVYRTFHKRRCYELDIRVAFSNSANYDPGTLKNFDSKKVKRNLKAVLASFKFLR